MTLSTQAEQERLAYRRQREALQQDVKTSLAQIAAWIPAVAQRLDRVERRQKAMAELLLYLLEKAGRSPPPPEEFREVVQRSIDEIKELRE